MLPAFEIISHYILSTLVHTSSSNKFRMLFDNHSVSLLCLQLILGVEPYTYTHTHTACLFLSKNSFQIHKTFAIYLLCVSLFPVSGVHERWKKKNKSTNVYSSSTFHLIKLDQIEKSHLEETKQEREGERNGKKFSTGKSINLITTATGTVCGGEGRKKFSIKFTAQNISCASLLLLWRVCLFGCLRGKSLQNVNRKSASFGRYASSASKR